MSKPSRVLVCLLLLVIAAVDILPLVFMLVSSLKDPLEYLRNPLGLPRSWLHLDNYITMGSRFDVVRLLGNTLAYAVAALALCLVVAIPASFTMAKLPFFGRTPVYLLVVASMAVPGVAVLVPNYLQFSHIGVNDSPVPVMVIWAVRALPATIFLISAVLRAVPDDLIEAARLDGAGYLRIVLSIVAPLSVPAVVTASIFNFTGWFNDVLLPLVFLSSEDKQTITVSIATLGQRMSGSDYPLTLAALLVSSVGPVVLYLFLQGYIRQGLVMGATR